jgi:hypothetical protein
MDTSGDIQGRLISLWLYKENNKLRDGKNVFALHIPPELHILMTSLTHPRQILLVVLQTTSRRNRNS